MVGFGILGEAVLGRDWWRFGRPMLREIELAREAFSAKGATIGLRHWASSARWASFVAAGTLVLESWPAVLGRDRGLLGHRLFVGITTRRWPVVTPASGAAMVTKCERIPW